MPSSGPHGVGDFEVTFSVPNVRAVYAPRPAEILTATELKVLQLLAAGHTSNQMATKLNLTVDTIKGYRKTLCRKLGATNSAHAVAIAFRKGVL
jgi:DNA-binding CsgD family transcriptional regulator